MPFQPCPNVVQVELIFTASSQPCENVFHVHVPGGVTLVDLTNLAAAFDAWHLAQYRLAQSAEVFLQKIVCTDLTSATSARLDHPLVPPRVGTSVSAPLPNNVTLAIKWSTGLRGRSQRGRTYLIGMVDAALAPDAQGVTPTYVTAILAAFQALITDVSGAGAYNLAVLSRFSGTDPVTHRPIPRAAGITHDITAAALADPYVDSQRRRLPAHNRHR